MNLGAPTVKSMAMASSSASWKSGDGVSDQFPVGLRVLVVDDDPTCLMILEKMLQNCRYEVTKCNRAEMALSLLRGNKNGFDIVISDVHMPDMDGFKLLEHVGIEMDLPVIMMSADDSKNVVMKGVIHGAYDYLIKPVRIEALKNIWQHVVRKRKNEFEQTGSVEDVERQKYPPEEADYSSSANEGNWKNSKRRKEEEDETEDRDDSSSLKKPRVVWSVELHQQFVAAVNQLGIDKAVPKKILELMSVPGLTRENVASHLQKYRLYLRRLSGVPQHQNGLNNSFMGPQDSTFGSMPSLNGLDLQALAATGQIPAQSLASLQASALARPGQKSSISMPIVDQRNLFSFETPKLRFGEGQQEVHNNNNNVKPMNLLQGIPTNLGPNLSSSGQSFGPMNIQVNNPQATHNSSVLVQMGSQVSRQPILASSIGSGILGRNGLVENTRGPVYNTAPQPSSMVDFSINPNVDLPGNSFPLGGNLGISSLVSKGPVIQEEFNSELKGLTGFAPSYDIFNDLNHHKPSDWALPNIGLSQSGLLQTGSSSGPNISSQLNGLSGEKLVRVKPEIVSDMGFQNNLYVEQYGQDDLMSALLKQQEGGPPVENEFGFDGYPLDNLPV